ncbi:ABC transporter permease [Streptomyces sp. NPDC002889]|uniref:ABC transporter permease n=1 Tax=Streptomyces sp. NPDC002889 TaxID=3364669 RepID=UPI0036913257
MTAPLTPPHQPPPNDNPWQSSPPPPYDGAEKAAPDPEGDLKRDLRDAAVVALVMTVLGVALGLLWLWLAPKVPLVSNGEAVFLKDTEGEEAIGADGTFVLLGVAFGAVTAAAVFWLRRRGGIALVVALAVGALLGSLLAWGVGVWFDPAQDVAQRAREVGEGVPFDAYLKLEAQGALLAWPLTAMVVHLGLTALFGPRDPEPEWEQDI